MNGNAYAVLFTCGALKVGITQRLSNRINTHIKAGKSFGHELSAFYFTEPHPLCEKTEQLLIRRCNEMFSATSKEYFTGADDERVRQLMLETGLLVSWGSAIAKTKNGTSCLIDSSNKAKKVSDTPEKAMSKIMYQLGNNPSGLSIAVLRNRVKSKWIDSILNDCMSDTERFSVREARHRRNGMKVTYLSIKRPDS